MTESRPVNICNLFALNVCTMYIPRKECGTLESKRRIVWKSHTPTKYLLLSLLTN